MELYGDEWSEMSILQLCESKDCSQALPSWRGINKVKCPYAR